MDPIRWYRVVNEESPDHSIQTTQCRCTPEQKERTRGIFGQPRSDVLSISKLSARETGYSNSSNQFRPGGIPKPKLDTLPREILYPILQIVWNEETRSRDLCHCSRPKTSYQMVRDIAFEHRIVNTIMLRGTCRAFRQWTLEQFERTRILEVDFSDLASLKKRFDTTGAGVARRLLEDFPFLVKTGIEIYLGNPGMVILEISFTLLIHHSQNPIPTTLN
jgi:hypothetical protein